MINDDLCNEKHTNIKEKFEALAVSWKEDFRGHKDWVRQELIKTDKKIEDTVLLVKETNAAIRSLTESIIALEGFMTSFKSGRKDIINKILYPSLQGVVLFLLLKYIK